MAYPAKVRSLYYVVARLRWDDGSPILPQAPSRLRIGDVARPHHGRSKYKQPDATSSCWDLYTRFGFFRGTRIDRFAAATAFVKLESKENRPIPETKYRLVAVPPVSEGGGPFSVGDPVTFPEPLNVYCGSVRTVCIMVYTKFGPIPLADSIGRVPVHCLVNLTADEITNELQAQKPEQTTEGPFMPVYEYRCPKCGESFTFAASMSESDKQRECPNCKESILRRILSSGVTVIVK